MAHHLLCKMDNCEANIDGLPPREARLEEERAPPPIDFDMFSIPVYGAAYISGAETA